MFLVIDENPQALVFPPVLLIFLSFFFTSIFSVSDTKWFPTVRSLTFDTLVWSSEHPALSLCVSLERIWKFSLKIFSMYMAAVFSPWNCRIKLMERFSKLLWSCPFFSKTLNIWLIAITLHTIDILLWRWSKRLQVHMFAVSGDIPIPNVTYDYVSSGTL